MASLEKIENKLDKVQKKFNEETLAMEMFREMKQDNKRKNVIIIILLVMLFATNIGWLIYESQFDTTIEDSTQETYYTDNSTINQNME